MSRSTVEKTAEAGGTGSILFNLWKAILQKEVRSTGTGVRIFEDSSCHPVSPLFARPASTSPGRRSLHVPSRANPSRPGALWRTNRQRNGGGGAGETKRGDLADLVLSSVDS